MILVIVPKVGDLHVSELGNTLKQWLQDNKKTYLELSRLSNVRMQIIHAIVEGGLLAPSEDIRLRLLDAMHLAIPTPIPLPKPRPQKTPDTPGDKDLPKVIIFTHFHGLSYNSTDFFLENRTKYIEYYSEVMKSYLLCNCDRHRIAILYGYVDWSFRIAAANIRFEEVEGRLELIVRGRLWREEQKLISDVLEPARRKAMESLEGTPFSHIKFHFVGLMHLIDLMGELAQVNPELVNLVSSRNNEFTYDSPKFIEAIIRLARGDTPHLAYNPIIRVDEDARPNPDAIDKLCRAYVGIIKKRPIWFFSGRYGREDGMDDPVNDHAVRTACFYPEGTIAGDSRFHNVGDEFEKSGQWTRTFLADLGELGATQILEVDENDLSKGLKNYIEANEKNDPEHDTHDWEKHWHTKRKSPQVISGAGLIMSRRAIELLPPFMNFDLLTTWVDDMIKRRLHEAIKDISPDDQESVADAKFEQNRHPDGTSGCGLWTRKYYFERLLRGCLLHAMVVSGEGGLTLYASTIRNFAWLMHQANDPADPQRLGTNAEASNKSDKTIFSDESYENEIDDDSETNDATIVQDMDLLRLELTNLANDRLCKVLASWTSDEFVGTDLHDWTMKHIQDMKQSIPEAKLPLWRDELVKDALDYVRLVQRWPIFARAISRLQMNENDWLYDDTGL